ncbi:MAG: hydantoinase B/oxoprolinase family protein [Reyranellaceae bacterium]
MSEAAVDIAFDPITLEVVRNKLDGIANEMEMVLVRSAFSTIVKEGLDASASLFTVHGETLAQAIATPIHLATLIPMVRQMLSTYPLSEMKEGDIYILNDAYLGGTHLPDIAIMMPIFYRGRPIAISAAMTHHQDVGGMTPGSTPTNATELFQEGIRIPLLKFRDAGVWNDTLIRMLRLNVRLPEVLMGDINAQVAACSIGARRLEELAENYGDNHLMSLFDELLDRSELMTRQALRALPEGTYRYVDYLDNDGVDLDRLVRIEVAVTVKGGTIACDFTGTDPQLRGPFNAVPSGSFAAACFAVRAVTDPENRIPNNGGCFRAISLSLPEGSLVNPREPAPVGCRTSTIKRVCSTILGALREAAPDRVPADPAGIMLIIHFGGRRADQSSFVTSQLLAAGSGASRLSDGVDFIETDTSNCMNVPAEAIMMEGPIRVHQVGLSTDSGGPGRHRGGLGGRFEYEALVDDVTLTFRGERHACAAAGAEEGGAGGRSRAFVRRLDGSEEVIPSKVVTRLNRGDRLYVETGGGGGHGRVALRDPARIAEDVRNGKVSAAAAAALYGVAEVVPAS